MPDGSTVQDLAASFHPFSDLLPAMGRKQFAELVADIAKHGLRAPIVKVGDMILDGRHRHRACREAGVEPRYEQYSGADPLGYVISANLHRRHLSQSQRAMVAAKLADMPQGARTDRGPSANLQKVSRPEAAKLLNVSCRSVADAKKVVERGTPELACRVERGEVSVSLAAQVAKMPGEQQAGVVKLGWRALRGAVKAALGERETAVPATKRPMGDRLLWGERQASLLRRLAAGKRIHGEVDWLNVAEAIEAPGRDLRLELAARVSTVLRGMIELGLATREHPGRRAWRAALGRELQMIALLLASAPSLQPTIPAVVNAELDSAKQAALEGLHAWKTSPCLFEGRFPGPLPHLRFENPYEAEMCAGWATHKVNFWASRFCLREARATGAAMLRGSTGGAQQFQLHLTSCVASADREAPLQRAV